jgi:hypothetical protein
VEKLKDVVKEPALRRVLDSVMPGGHNWHKEYEGPVDCRPTCPFKEDCNGDGPQKKICTPAWSHAKADRTALLVVQHVIQEFKYYNEGDLKVTPELPGAVRRLKTLIKRRLSQATDEQDEREKQLRAITVRQSQSQFREALLRAYGRRCAITGSNAEAVLEAAHMIPYFGAKAQDVTNGVLLRADVHKLFDLGYFGIHPRTLRVVVGPKLRRTEYRTLHHKPIFLPRSEGLRPARRSLAAQWKRFLAVR